MQEIEWRSQETWQGSEATQPLARTGHHYCLLLEQEGERKEAGGVHGVIEQIQNYREPIEG